MVRLKSGRWGIGGALALCWAFVLGIMPLHGAAAATNPCAVFGVQNVTLQPILPVQFSPSVNQLGADCMAWQSFIALNWAADPNNPGQPDQNAPPSSFGTPQDPMPKVWETYLAASAVFNPPPNALKAWSAPRPAIKSLSRISKMGATDLSLSNISQAGDGKWLTGQSRGLTYYEVRLNQDEYEFITKNVFSGADLTSFAGQAACASEPGQNQRGGFNLPAGGGGGASSDTDCQGNATTYGQNVGSIEVKAAWTALPTDHSLDYRYKTALAEITAPDGTILTTTVGLVGLHIIHKVPGAPQFVWATFEQIDNTPDQSGTGSGFAAPVLPANGNQKPSPGYTYFNPNCTDTTDPTYKCVHNQLPGKPCDPKGLPAGCDPLSAPMQITRLVPTDTTSFNVTGYAWSLFPANSVFNYYRLINVQWPSSPAQIKPQSTTPLSTGDITPAPSSGIVANTTLESFQQNKNACMSCHQAAPVAQARNQVAASFAGRPERKVEPQQLLGSSAPFASDYSFLFVSETIH